MQGDLLSSSWLHPGVTRSVGAVSRFPLVDLGMVVVFLVITGKGATSLELPRAVIETWRREYNQERPKKVLSGMTPEAYAKHLAEVRLQ